MQRIQLSKIVGLSRMALQVLKWKCPVARMEREWEMMLTASVAKGTTGPLDVSEHQPHDSNSTTCFVVIVCANDELEVGVLLFEVWLAQLAQSRQSFKSRRSLRDTKSAKDPRSLQPAGHLDRAGVLFALLPFHVLHLL